MLFKLFQLHLSVCKLVIYLLVFSKQKKKKWLLCYQYDYVSKYNFYFKIFRYFCLRVIKYFPKDSKNSLLACRFTDIYLFFNPYGTG